MATANYRKERAAWYAAKQRCYNPNFIKFAYYGGRGIKMSDEWRASFDQFLADVGPAPGPEYSLDRYPNQDGNYEKGNVRWSTQKQQMRNMRRNTILTSADGSTYCISEWAERIGVHPDKIIGWLSYRTNSTIDEYMAACPKGHIPLKGRPKGSLNFGDEELFLTDYRGHRDRAILKSCMYCHKEFLATKTKDKQGRARYCSTACAHLSYKKV